MQNLFHCPARAPPPIRGEMTFSNLFGGLGENQCWELLELLVTGQKNDDAVKIGWHSQGLASLHEKKAFTALCCTALPPQSMGTATATASYVEPWVKLPKNWMCIIGFATGLLNGVPALQHSPSPRVCKNKPVIHVH